MIVQKKLWWIPVTTLILFCGGLLFWASIPVKQESEVKLLQPSMMRTGGEANGEAVLEERLVRLKWPSSVRIGDQVTIQLSFDKADKEASPSSDKAGFEDAYKNYSLMVEARFEAAGLNLKPANPTRESMPRGQPVRFLWEIMSDKTGWYEGTIWLSLRFLPLDGSTPIQVPIYVRDVKLHSRSFLGLSGPMARIFGGVGMVVGLGLVMIKKFTTKGTKDSKDTK